MATVRELTDPYVNVMLAPLPPSAHDVCRVCLTFTTGFPTCYRCDHQPEYADAVLPISYSPQFGQLHTVLANYKRGVAQSAAGSLKSAGSGPVGVLVIGRHVQPSFQDNEARLKSLPGPFSWESCALHRG